MSVNTKIVPAELHDKDVVFVLYSEVHKESDEKTTTVVAIQVIRRCLDFVRVVPSKETAFQRRLRTDYYEYYEDAVRAYASELRDLNKKVAVMEKNIKAMREKIR